jgi:hypothetical protein
MNSETQRWISLIMISPKVLSYDRATLVFGINRTA